MDIIIRDVEEKDGQYKIYNKDGTGGHWYISKESAEEISNLVEARVSPIFTDEENSLLRTILVEEFNRLKSKLYFDKELGDIEQKNMKHDLSLLTTMVIKVSE